MGKLTPPQQQEAWKKTVETAPEGKVTAKHVEKIVDEMEGMTEQTREIIESEKEHANKDSKNLSQMKFYWGESSIADRKKFRRWLRTQRD